MWHVSSRSGVATLRTAMHLLLTLQPVVQPVVKPGTRFSDRGGMQSWVDLLTWRRRGQETVNTVGNHFQASRGRYFKGDGRCTRCINTSKSNGQPIDHLAVSLPCHSLSVDSVIRYFRGHYTDVGDTVFALYSRLYNRLGELCKWAQPSVDWAKFLVEFF